MSEGDKTGFDYVPEICGVFRERVFGDLRCQLVFDQYGAIWTRLVYESKLAQVSGVSPHIDRGSLDRIEARIGKHLKG